MRGHGGVGQQLCSTKSHVFNYLVTYIGADLPANERLDNQYGVVSAR